jgi:hypothetical protein
MYKGSLLLEWRLDRSAITLQLLPPNSGRIPEGAYLLLWQWPPLNACVDLQLQFLLHIAVADTGQRVQRGAFGIREPDVEPRNKVPITCGVFCGEFR